MTYLNYNWISEGRVLRLVANVPDGWREKTKTYCFSEHVSFEWDADCRVSITVSVFPRPSGHDADNVQPQVPDGVGEIRCLWYCFDDSTLELKIPLRGGNSSFNMELPWRLTSTHRPCLHWQIEPMNLVSGRDGVLRIGRSYELQVLVVVQPKLDTGPITRDWESKFFPGGLPGLGRRT